MNREEKIKEALTNEEILQTIAYSLKKGNPIELKIERDKLVVVNIERHAKVKVEIGN